MSQTDNEKPAAASFFHPVLLSRQVASGQIAMQGGSQSKTLETLHSMLCEGLLRDSRQARNLKYHNFVKMSGLLSDKDGAFQMRLGRGLAAESFRTNLLSWLESLRAHKIVEILPVLEHKGAELVCNDYVIVQEDKAQDLALEPFRDEILSA